MMSLSTFHSIVMTGRSHRAVLQKVDDFLAEVIHRLPGNISSVIRHDDDGGRLHCFVLLLAVRIHTFIARFGSPPALAHAGGGTWRGTALLQRIELIIMLRKNGR